MRFSLSICSSTNWLIPLNGLRLRFKLWILQKRRRSFVEPDCLPNWLSIKISGPFNGKLQLEILNQTLAIWFDFPFWFYSNLKILSFFVLLPKFFNLKNCPVQNSHAHCSKVTPLSGRVRWACPISLTRQIWNNVHYQKLTDFQPKN